MPIVQEEVWDEPTGTWIVSWYNEPGHTLISTEFRPVDPNAMLPPNPPGFWKTLLTVFEQRSTKLRLLADVPNSTTTPIGLAGMTFIYKANSFYVFDMYMLASSSAATTGYGFALNTSTSVTFAGLTFHHQLATAGTRTGGDSIADDTPRGLSSGVPAITVTNVIKGSGTLISGATGGLAQFSFRPEVAAAAICKAGSIILVREI